MKRLLIGLLFLCGAEGAALACSCAPPPRNAAGMRQMAEEMAGFYSALVEVDVLSGYDPRRGIGERMRTRQVLAGSAPRHFRIARERAPQSSMCDTSYQPGSRVLLLLRPAEPARRGGERQFQDSGSCAAYIVQVTPGFRDALINAFRRRQAASLIPGAAMVRRSGAGLASQPCAPRAGAVA